MRGIVREKCLPSANVDIVILGDLLIGLLGSTRDSSLDSLSDVVDGLLGGLHFDCCLVVWG